MALTRHLANARLVTVRGHGRTTPLNPSRRVGDHQVRYFLTGAPPPRGAVCGQDVQPFAPGTDISAPDAPAPDAPAPDVPDPDAPDPDVSSPDASDPDVSPPGE